MPTDNLDKLATEMFFTFARFEYALKAAGYHRGEGPAEPDWDRFAQDMQELFQSPPNATFERAIKYLQGYPPKKQIINADGQLEWREAGLSGNGLSNEILTHVRRVRNNLHHGGKFNGHWFEPERSEPLLKHSLDILNGCLKVSPSVREAYNKR